MKKEYAHVKQEFDLVLDAKSKILILGSFPSVKSREVGYFYMNPQNRFWKVISCLLNKDFISMDKKAKTEALLKHHIALYDVIEECDIIGSSDSSIKNVKYLDIEKILSNSQINKLYLNGALAYNLFVKRFPKYRTICYKLPSTSPANAKCDLETLLNEWKIILE